MEFMQRGIVLSTYNKSCDDFTPHTVQLHPHIRVCACCHKTEQEHYPNVTPRNCIICGSSIPLARLDIIPDTQYCTGCVDRHGPKKVHDPNVICAKASLSGSNGFSPKD